MGSAKDLGTGKEQQITIQSSGGLSDAEIEHMVKMAEEHAEADRNKRELSEARNNGDSLVYSTQKSLDEHKSKLPADVISDVETKLAATKGMLESEDLAALKSSCDDLSKAASKIGEAIYQNRGGSEQ